MSKLRCHITISLDGFVAGPNQSQENPLGEGGERLHSWMIPLAAWRESHGQEGGEVNESARIVEESRENIGAAVMGRNMFGPAGGGAKSTDMSKGAEAMDIPSEDRFGDAFAAVEQRITALRIAVSSIVQNGCPISAVTNLLVNSSSSCGDSADGISARVWDGSFMALLPFPGPLPPHCETYARPKWRI